jgi:hypothetical protein
MTKLLAASTVAALTLVVAVCTGGAFAGNGNGNGHDGGAPGNSENAPGQLKKDGAPPAAAPAPQPAPVAAPAPAAPTAGAASHGQAKQTASTEGSSLPGIKPSSTTHDHKNAIETADSGKTKKYGNGNTAGNIAMSRGARGSTQLKGPGNSQPHKVWDCRRQHWVDVHAVKAYASQDCSPAQQQTAAPTPSSKTESTCEWTTTTTSESAIKGIVHHTGSMSNPTVVLKYNGGSAHARGKHGDDALIVETVTKTTRTPTGAECGAPVVTTSVVRHEQPTAPTVTVNAAVPAPAPVPVPAPAAPATSAAATPSAAATASAPAAAAAPARSGVLGLQTTMKPKSSSHGVLGAQSRGTTPHGVLGTQSHGVLGTTQNLARRTLPFTGVELWIFALVAGALVAGGLALRRSGRGAL